MNGFKFNNHQFEIASPCDENWDQMMGDDKTRHCDSCEKNVYNLSAMKEEEISELLSRPEKVCVRLYKRHDGTVLTEDCPVGLDQVKGLLKRKQFVAALMCFITIMMSNVTHAGNKDIKGKVAYTPDEHTLMGDVAYPTNHNMVMGEFTAPPVEPTPTPVPTPTQKEEDEKELWKKVWE